MNPQKVFIAVPTSERYPNKTGRYVFVSTTGKYHEANFNRGNDFFHWPITGIRVPKESVTHWLEPREGYLEEEMIKLLNWMIKEDFHLETDGIWKNAFTEDAKKYSPKELIELFNQP